MSHAPTFPEVATCQTMYDYFAWFVQTGRGADRATLDQRGLSFLVLPQYVGKDIGLCLPPPDETDNPVLHKVYLRATF